MDALIVATAPGPPSAGPSGTYHDAVCAFKRQLIESTLLGASGNRTHAARALGLQRTYLLRLIRELRVTAPPPPTRGRPGTARGSGRDALGDTTRLAFATGPRAAQVREAVPPGAGTGRWYAGPDRDRPGVDGAAMRPRGAVTPAEPVLRSRPPRRGAGRRRYAGRRRIQ
jgi:hypothetical protein